MVYKFEVLMRKEANWIFALGLVLAFLLVNFNLAIGVIYLTFLLLEFIAREGFVEDIKGFGLFPTLSGQYSISMSVLVGLGVLSGFLLFASFVISIVQPSINSVASLIQFMQSQFQAATPLLSEDPYIKFAVMGIVGPLVETRFFFGPFLKWSSSLFNSSLEFALANLKMWFTFAWVAAWFAVFHLTAKFAVGNVAFLVTFLFGIASCLVVVVRKQLLEAKVLHVANNMISLGVFNKILGLAGLFK